MKTVFENNIQKNIYNKAVEICSQQADNVLYELEQLANQCDYEKDWVVEEFRKQFNKKAKEFLGE